MAVHSGMSNTTTVLNLGGSGDVSTETNICSCSDSDRNCSGSELDDYASLPRWGSRISSMEGCELVRMICRTGVSACEFHTETRPWNGSGRQSNYTRLLGSQSSILRLAIVGTVVFYQFFHLRPVSRQHAYCCHGI